MSKNNKKKIERDYLMKFTESNDLVDAIFDCSLLEIRIIKLAISKIPTKIITKIDKNGKEKKIKVQSLDDKSYIRIRTSEFLGVYNSDKKHAYKNIREAISKLKKSDLLIRSLKTDDVGNVVPHVKTASWLADYENPEKSSSYIDIRFHDAVVPHVSNMTENILTLDLNIVSKFNSTHAIKLYSKLKKYQNLGRYKTKSGDTCLQILVSDLMTFLSQTDKSRFSQFRARVLVPAIKQINLFSDILVTAEINSRRGVSVEVITLTYKKKSAKSLENAPKRPRLRTRPHVISGSHEHGVWAKENLNRLYSYRSAMLAFYKEHGIDEKFSFTTHDQNKIDSYLKIIGESKEKYEASDQVESENNCNEKIESNEVEESKVITKEEIKEEPRQNKKPLYFESDEDKQNAFKRGSDNIEKLKAMMKNGFNVV